MSFEINFRGLAAAAKVVADEAYNQGYQAGYADAVAKILAAAQGDSGASDSKPDIAIVRDRSTFIADAKTRARRGATDEALERVLTEKPGLTQDEVEAAVAAYDDTVSPKSVYNRLRQWEKQGKKYRRKANRWYRIADLPSDLPIFRDGRLINPNQTEASV